MSIPDTPLEKRKVPSEYNISENDSESVSANPSVFSGFEKASTSPLDDKQLRLDYQRHAADAVNIRDEHFNALLKAFQSDYSSRSSDKRIMKRIFFGIASTLLVLMVISIFLLPVLLLVLELLSPVTYIVSIITSLASIITAFIILPEIIAKYLFDPKEDENFIELIKNMQEYNTRGHDRLDQHK